MNELPKMKGLVQQHEEWLNSQDEKDSKPEINPELTATSKDITIHAGKISLEEFSKAVENTLGRKDAHYEIPTGMPTSDDSLNLRVQQGKEAERKFKEQFTPIKKSRSKMSHLTPKKKKRR